MNANDGVISIGLCILALTLFLDLLELSFGRILWFMRTLRFWLYFLLHLSLSFLAAYLIHTEVDQWYLLAPAATFLGVGVISNTNIKIAGYSLVPIADLFTSVKGKMFEQAAEDKAAEVDKAKLIERLQKLPTSKIEAAYFAGLEGAGKKNVAEQLENLRKTCRGDDNRLRSAMASRLVKVNRRYAEEKINDWESGG